MSCDSVFIVSVLHEHSFFLGVLDYLFTLSELQSICPFQCDRFLPIILQIVDRFLQNTHHSELPAAFQVSSVKTSNCSVLLHHRHDLCSVL